MCGPGVVTVVQLPCGTAKFVGGSGVTLTAIMLTAGLACRPWAMGHGPGQALGDVP